MAIYGQGEQTALNKIFTKVTVGNIADLSKEGNKKHILVDVNENHDYWIMALFEDGKTEPSLIVQISGKYDVLRAEKWLTHLNIINPKFASLDKEYDYYQDVIDAQYDVVSTKGAANYPAYILNRDKTAYADSWNNSSVTVLCHMSHWAGYRWHQGADRYKDTKGEIEKIL